MSNTDEDRRNVLRVLGAAAAGLVVSGTGCAPTKPRPRYIIAPPKGSENLVYKMLPEARTYSSLADPEVQIQKMMKNLNPVADVNGHPVYEAGTAFTKDGREFYIWGQLSTNIRGNPVFIGATTSGLTAPTDVRVIGDGVNGKYDGNPEGSLEFKMNNIRDLRDVKGGRWKPVSVVDKAVLRADMQNIVGNLLTAYANGKF